MKRLLIVEDDDSVRALAARALERAGYAVDVAADGRIGLEKVATAGGHYDLIISDIRMPGMDGVEMARALVKTYPTVRILFVTGYADQRERAAELDGIVAGVLQKPFTLAEIRAKVDRLLAVAA